MAENVRGTVAGWPAVGLLALLFGQAGATAHSPDPLARGKEGKGTLTLPAALAALAWAVRASGCCWPHNAGGGFRPVQEQAHGQVRFEQCQVNPPCAGAHHLAPAENEGAGFGTSHLATVDERRPDGQEQDWPGVHPPPGVPREGVHQMSDIDRETALSARWTAARPYRIPPSQRSRSGAPTAHLLPSPPSRDWPGQVARQRVHDSAAATGIAEAGREGRLLPSWSPRAAGQCLGQHVLTARHLHQEKGTRWTDLRSP